MKINKNLIKDCSVLMDKLGLTELEYTEGNNSIKLSKNKSENFSNLRQNQDIIEVLIYPLKSTLITDAVEYVVASNVQSVDV